jgi:phosphoglycolate phosphatase-like HAD superfamily hydrolase
MVRESFSGNLSDGRGLLIFDLDGTLFRAETATVPAVRQVLRDIDIRPPDASEVMPFFGRPTSDFHAWLRSQCAPEQADQAVAAVDRLELDYIAERGELYPGVIQALEQLRIMSAQMAICSNGYPAYVDRVVAIHRLGPFFDVVRCQTAPADNKTSMIAELQDRLVARPAIVIGDRGDDIEAAHKNGALAVAAGYGYGAGGELEAADARAGSALELPGLILPLLN